MRMMTVATFVVGVLGSVWADSIVVGREERMVLSVDEGRTLSQTDRVSVQDGGRLMKVGKGTLELPTASVLQNNPLRLEVLEGRVNLGFGGVAPDETADDAEAEAILNRSAFWVRADVGAGLVVTNGNLVAQWRDVREGAVTDPDAAHAYPYALPKWDASLSTKPRYGKPPVLETAYGKGAVYFGGWGSSQKMWWYKPDGSELKLSGICNAFIVQGVSNSFGYAVMARSGQDADFHVGNTGGSVAGPLFNGFASDAKAVRDYAFVFVDGERVDTANVEPPRERHFLEDIRFAGRLANAGAFFTDRDINGRTGGDYLGEMAVFTNRLTDVECEKVSRYLLRRFGLGKTPTVALDLAKGASVGLSVAAGEVLSSACTLSGVGTVSLSGGGTLDFGVPTEPFDGDFSLAATVARLRAPIKYHMVGGENISVNGGEVIAATVTTATGTPGEFGKLGSGELRVDSVPDDVRNIRVEAGELQLTAPVSEAGIARRTPVVVGEDVVGTFANGDFTVMTNDYPNSGQVDVLYSKGQQRTLLSWTGFCNVDYSYSPQVFFVNWDKFDGGSHGKWPSGGKEPPASRCFIAVKGDATAESTFAVTEAGDYEITFHAQGRYDRASEYHSPIDVLIGPDADRLTTLGTVISAQEDEWQPYAYQTGHLEPGTYVIRLATQTTGKDNCTCFADFAVRRVVSVVESADYSVPNGDFETVDDGVVNLDFTTGLRLKGWTFDQGTYFDKYTSAKRPAIGACANGIAPYNTVLARTAVYGANRMRLAFCGGTYGAFAETTFTPPAGTYILKGEAAAFQGIWTTYKDAEGKDATTDARQIPQIEASVTINGITTSLGTNAVRRQIMAEETWPKSFAVDGRTPVTLRLANVCPTVNSAGMIDNLRLVGAARGVELVSDGGFENNSSLWTWTSHADAAVSGLSYSRAERMDITTGFNRENWSTDTSVGKYVARICQSGEISQTLDFPAAGLYRLRFRSQSRPNGPNGGYGSGANPIRAFLTRDGVRTEIGWMTLGNTNFVEHAMDFRVTEPGNYVLSLQGMCDGTAGHVWPSGKDQTTMVDGVSVVGLGDDVAPTPNVPETVEIAVAQNARLRLDFAGTNRVKSVRYDGHRLTGVISAETCPDFVQGPGVLEVPRHGFYLLFR